MAWGLSLAGGGGPWLGGSSGLSLVGVGCRYSLRGCVSPPLRVGKFSWFLIHV